MSIRHRSKTLGVGLGFREPFRSDIFLNRAEIDFLEITADHYFDANEAKQKELELLNENFELIPHGLDLSLGSAEGIDEEYLEKFAELVEFVQPEWFSDHICFTRAGGTNIGHLAPLPFTREAVAVVAANLKKVQRVIETPLILENITYLVRFPSSEMDEAEFLTRIVSETGCGLLLDVTNLYINSQNFAYDWRRFLDGIPTESVVQVHFVGSHRNGKRLIDAHLDKTEEEIWEVFREVCKRTELKGAVLERDGNFPPFDEIVNELRQARTIMQTN